ncbi:unnamed protein product [Adineta ricciae]|uniref:Uncharacterized protein n=1 Tax=Adineta ricciae TaxID=249248 RepID=A0A815IYG9_ADIRI|nr:unnamed protein product [Adineta ricciae]CAF1537912.1 unnamed protein product [Adineta ricciae]
MLLLLLVTIWQVQSIPTHRLNMYDIDHQQLDGFCLLYYVTERLSESISPDYISHQIIAYCLRPFEKEQYDLPNNQIYQKTNFTRLRQLNVSSELLLAFSASIYMAENYQMFLNDEKTLSMLSEDEQVFHTCRSSWFGPQCRFSFLSNTDKTFREIVELNFKSKLETTLDEDITCYQHIHCELITSSTHCFDWRMICDGKIDCIDSIDEYNCWLLEINECSKNEYRCYNGQCIPSEFFQNDPENPDCLDQTDEPPRISGYRSCHQDPSFRCEEYTCHPGSEKVRCRDGECSDEDLLACSNDPTNTAIDGICLMSMLCLMKLYDQVDYEKCQLLCAGISNCFITACSPIFQFPSSTILLGHVRFIFTNERKNIKPNTIRSPDYVCYDEKLCQNVLPITEHLDGLTCRSFYELGLNVTTSYDNLTLLIEDIKTIFQSCSLIANKIDYCNYTTMYLCNYSDKCISKYRLVDGIQDCPFNDDETFEESCALDDFHFRVQCLMNRKITCFASITINDDFQDCDNGEDEDHGDFRYKTHLYFQTVCDGFTEMKPLFIDDRYETDETNCEYWLCDNSYTRCDEFWSCRNGADEVNCPSSICPNWHHHCVFPNNTNVISCLPISQADNYIIDCLGGTDEPFLCRTQHPDHFRYRFHCVNSTICVDQLSLCDHETQCPEGDDESFCSKYGSTYDELCLESPHFLTDVETFLCKNAEIPKKHLVYFTIHDMPTYLSILDNYTTTTLSTENKLQTVEIHSTVTTRNTKGVECHRGIPICIQITNTTCKIRCLCPPSYYGAYCQFQNQRVSISLEAQVVTDFRNMFKLIIKLLNNNSQIESYDSIEYLPIRDCNTRFNIYLLYSTRNKNSSEFFSVRIDAFNQLTMVYRTSWIFPLAFSFLPVYRLSILLKFPASNTKSPVNCPYTCVHGTCYNYVNDRNSTFCQCDTGWSGKQCNIRSTGHCANNSLWIDNSICVCPLGYYGPRCYLSRPECSSTLCLNDGQCMTADERHTVDYSDKPHCICSQEYSGNRCEHRQTRIDISFDRQVTIPLALLLHFIVVQKEAEPIRISTMKNIRPDQSALSIFTSTEFNIAFIEIFRTYYLIILRQQTIVSLHLSAKILPSHRCRSLTELFNETFSKEHLIKRIKYYHIPCQQQLDLICFHDDTQICLCDLNRRTDCFEFNHNTTYDCQGNNFCENNGQCFRDNIKCPTTSMCICPECFYGSRCQFTTKGSVLSLDTILGYHIHQDLDMKNQSITLKIMIILIMLIFFIGVINGILTLLTFSTKNTRSVGCGLYLITSSIISLITIIVLIIKFWFLVISHMNLIENKSLTHIQCVCLDFSLRILLSTNGWFNSCVSIERTINALKGIKFNKTKSKQIAKWIIPICILITSCTYIYDPIHRRLTDDDEEKRSWCITDYSSTLKLIDRYVDMFHFLVPFLINMISALIIIMIVTRYRSNVAKTQSYTTFTRTIPTP